MSLSLFLKNAIGAACVALACAASAESFSGSRSGVKLDTRRAQVRPIAVKAQILPFACNSETNAWVAGGRAGVASTARVATMSVLEVGDVSTWKEISSEDLPSVTGEGLATWTPDRRGYYRVQLLVEGGVGATGYFDLSKTSDLSGGSSIEDAVITLSAASVAYAGSPVSLPEGISVVLDQKTLVEGRDYSILYSNNVFIGTAHAVFIGAGDYEGRVDKTFEIVPAAVVPVADGDRVGSVDTRTNAVLAVASKAVAQRLAFNTSETFTTFTPSEWLAGGFVTNATVTSAVARVSLAPMADATSAPDESQRKILCLKPGEGTVRFPGVPRGFYEAKLQVLTNGVERAGALTRVLYLERGSGLTIFVR